MDEQAETKLGVIDSLSLGFQLVARRPWLLILPVLLDLFLWLGPRISLRPLLGRLLLLLAQVPSDLSEDVQQMFTLSREMLEQMGEHWNLLSLLAQGVVGVPSFIGSQIAVAVPWQPPVAMPVSSVGGALGWGVLAGLGGILLGGLYLSLIAAQVRRWRMDETSEAAAQTDSPGFWRALGLTWVRLLLLSLLLLGIILVVTLPISLVGGVLSLINPGFAISSMSLLSMIAVSLGLWAGFIMFFVSDAIVMDDVGVLQGMWRSANVVWRNLWPTLGIAFLSYVIGAGFTLIWDRIADTTWGTAVGILGTAYIGAAITAAGLAFYRDRRRRWLETAAPRAV
jgi:hypothetical protein